MKVPWKLFGRAVNAEGKLVHKLVSAKALPRPAYWHKPSMPVRSVPSALDARIAKRNVGLLHPKLTPGRRSPGRAPLGREARGMLSRHADRARLGSFWGAPTARSASRAVGGERLATEHVNVYSNKGRIKITSGLQTGPKGGQFYTTKGGKRRYVR